MKTDPDKPDCSASSSSSPARGRQKFDSDRQSGSVLPEQTVSSGAGQRSASEAVESFVRQLAPQERMLVVLKRQLYEGSWQAMMTDLNNRLDGKPYIFKLATRIHDDIDRITRLKKFEDEHEVDLADFVQPPGV